MFRKTLYFIGLPVFTKLSISSVGTTNCECNEKLLEQYKNNTMSGTQFKQKFENFKPIVVSQYPNKNLLSLYVE